MHNKVNISVIPRTIAERLLARAKANGYRVLYPEYASRMARITRLAKTKHNVHLTAHYFRKRAETIAEKIPNDIMNMNHRLILERGQAEIRPHARNIQPQLRR